MYPIQVGNYDFKRFYLWLQYYDKLPAFTEIVIEVFYPNNMQADGLVMFNHGFLIGTDFLFYPKLLLSKITNQDTPLYEINPSWYYNYSQAAIDNNWALAFVTTCHQQFDIMPWTDLGGNPRVGQAAYAAASYLIRYGATYKYQDDAAVAKAKFLNSDAAKNNSMDNRVIFAGHSVGGAHAQVAASGFDALQRIGAKNLMPFDPIFYNREFIPDHTPPLSEWSASMRAKPAGLLQLSPVDGAGGRTVPFMAPGMKPYREYLSGVNLPNLMVTGACDSACLDAANSCPPAWIDVQDRSESQYAQMAYSNSNSWAATCMVERGSHCGYLGHCNDLCKEADKKSKCESSVTPYAAREEEFHFTGQLLDHYIRFIEGCDQANCTFDDWKNGSLIQWLNKEKPEDSGISLKPLDGSYVHFSH
ncbi:MAG: hypothetical protein HGA97_07045 [Chlorobiaceae bacterium]|jgi:hypothetical protein|nr:hypothetical protein [Chlorobiaceae bacterium]